MNRHKKRFKKRRLVDMTEMLMMTCLPRSTARCIANHIRQLKCREQNNPIKSLFETGKPPMVLHVVPFVKPGVKLYQQSQYLMPDIWRNYLMERSLPVKLSEASGSETTSNKHVADISEKADKNCSVKTKISKLNGQFKSITLKNKGTKHSSKKYFLTSEKTVTLPDRRLTEDSDVNHTIKMCIKEQTKSKSSPLDGRNVIRCKISRFSKGSVEKGTTDRNVLEVNSDRPQSLQNTIREVAEGDTEKLKETKYHNKSEIKQNKIPDSVKLCNETDTYIGNSISSHSNNMSGEQKKTTTIVISNNCNGELEAVTKISVHSKPIENNISANSTKISSSESISHKPRPPSTVKLKETPNLTSKYNLNRVRLKVPTSSRSQNYPKSKD